MKTQVSIEYINELLAKIHEFNNYNLAEIELTENGEPIPISDKCLSEFKFIGLTNCWFVEDRCWEINLEE